MEEKPSISEEEVGKVVENKLKSDKFKIASFTLEMLGEWMGLCGDHALLKVKIHPDEELTISETELSFFLKIYPRMEAVVDFIEWTGSFRKEIFIYKLFKEFENEEIKILEDCVAKCYLTVPKKFLVMENLTELGYSSMNKFELFDYDTINVVLQALAKLHASSLIFEEKNNCRLIDLHEEDFEETYFNDRENFPFKGGIEAALLGILNCIEIFDLPKKLLSGKDFRTVLEQTCGKVYNLAKPSKTYRNVVTHGDIWATNIMVKYDNHKPIKCKLVDFQCGRYAPPAQDVMSVIHLTTSREFRKKNMYNLIGVYYTTLEKLITLAGFDIRKIIPFDQFLASCEEQKVFAMIQTSVYFPLILLKSEEVQNVFGNKEENKEALLVDRSLLIKKHMDKNEDYRNRNRDSILDLKDYCDYL